MHQRDDENGVIAYLIDHAPGVNRDFADGHIRQFRDHAGTGPEHVWTLDTDVKYYDARRSDLPAEYSVLPAYITAAASNGRYSTVVSKFINGIDGSKNWVLCQEINIEGASFSASLLYISPHDNMPYMVTFLCSGPDQSCLAGQRIPRRTSWRLCPLALIGLLGA